MFTISFGGRQLENIASKDGERISTFFLTTAVEKREALVVGYFEQALNVVDDFGCEEGFARAS